VQAGRGGLLARAPRQSLQANKRNTLLSKKKKLAVPCSSSCSWLSQTMQSGRRLPSWALACAVPPRTRLLRPAIPSIHLSSLSGSCFVAARQTLRRRCTGGAEGGRSASRACDVFTRRRSDDLILVPSRGVARQPCLPCGMSRVATGQAPRPPHSRPRPRRLPGALVGQYAAVGRKCGRFFAQPSGWC
jgi:hypothetical protein